MPAALLDVNILVALAWPPQQHDTLVREWFARRSEDGWATCAVTQNGFPRTMLNPALQTSLTVASVIVLLEASTGHVHHRLWADARGLPELLRPFAPCLHGHKQITDAYLIALAVRNEGLLVTLDRGAAALASAVGHTRSVELSGR